MLTPAGVNVNNFGQLWAYTVDGQVYAQPLYVPKVTIPGKGIYNVVYVATEHDSVYAFDAESNGGELTTPLWSRSFINPPAGITTLSINDVDCDDAVAPEIGITGTPVIDLASSTIYVVAATKENGKFFQRLHALDLADGHEKFGGPVAIAAIYPGTGYDNVNGVITFNPLTHLQRPALLLNQGNVYISWASYCDTDPWHGWIIGYDKNTLKQTVVWNATPNGGQGGIWMGGAGLAADGGGNIFAVTGNGSFDDTLNQPVNVGDSVVKLSLQGNSLKLLDFFTPFDQAWLSSQDLDLGSSGALLLPIQKGPHPFELVTAGKEGTLYLISRDNMGHYNPNDNSQVVQTISLPGGLFSTASYWNGNVYTSGLQDNIRAFSLVRGRLSPTATSTSPQTFRWPAISMAISSNGNSSGILWGLETSPNSASVLHAYDATNLDNELYNSSQNYSRDNPGGPVKFVIPTVANGRVYVGTAQRVSVYGLLSSITPEPAISPFGGTFATPQTVTITDGRPDAVIHYTTDGTDPNSASPIYTGPLAISDTTKLKVMATAAGASPSTVAVGRFTFADAGGGSISYANGIQSAGMVLNGSAKMNGTRLRITDGHPSENGSAWYSKKVNIQAFTQDFLLQATNAVGDGMTFVIQNNNTAALGGGGGYLGYWQIPNSLAIKFDLYSNQGEGFDSTGLYTGGAPPILPSVDMSATPIDLHSQRVLAVHMIYDGVTLTMRIFDTVTNQSFTTSWTIDIPSVVGGQYAYLGFTGSSGGVTAVQDVLAWSFASQGAVNYSKGMSPQGMVFNASARMHGSRVQLTDGGTSELATAWYNTPVNIQSFTQDLSFQISNPVGDGIMFVLQNAGPNAIGAAGGGLGYAADLPSGIAGVTSSVGVKFDLWDNEGEGFNSTGLYLNAARPTVPAIDLTPSGVSLHSSDVINVHMTYDGTTLSMKLTDAVTQQSFLNSWKINIPATVGGKRAYIGFTGASGGVGAIQEILTWSYAPQNGGNQKIAPLTSGSH